MVTTLEISKIPRNAKKPVSNDFQLGISLSVFTQLFSRDAVSDARCTGAKTEFNCTVGSSSSKWQYSFRVHGVMVDGLLPVQTGLHSRTLQPVVERTF